jgi:teichuronic acid biosynthesis glycosyltransferase TuaC
VLPTTGPSRHVFSMCSASPSWRPLRLLTFTTLFPNSQQPTHGVFVENRLRHLVASGEVESRVVAPVPYFPSAARRFGDWGRYAQVDRREMRHGLIIDHPRFPVIPRIGMSIGPALLAAATTGFVRRLLATGVDFDVIDAHYFYPDGVAALWIGRRLRRPVVITARGTDINLLPRYSPPRRMICWAIANADRLIAVSEALKRALVDLGAVPDHVEVLRNGVDLSMFGPTDRRVARQSLALTRPTLLSVGHLIERKGHDRVIEAMSRLPDFDLIIVGEGPEREALGDLARRVGVADQVRFLGSRPHATLPEVYGAADALVLASSREGWPNVLLEAMACGTPVIASNIWGNPEVVQAPASGVLMEQNTPEGIASAVRSLFANLPARVATRAYAEGFSWEDTTRAQIALFRGVVARRPSLSTLDVV